MCAHLATRDKTVNIDSLYYLDYREHLTEVVFSLDNEVLEGFIIGDIKYLGAPCWVLSLSSESANKYHEIEANNVFKGLGNKPFDVIVLNPGDDVLCGRRHTIKEADLEVSDFNTVFLYTAYNRRNSLTQFKNYVRDFEELGDTRFFRWYDLEEYLVDGYKSESERDAWIQSRQAEMERIREERSRAYEEHWYQRKLAAEKATRAQETRARVREKVWSAATFWAAVEVAYEAKIAEEILNFREEIEAMEATRLQWSLQAPSEMEAAAAEAEAELDEQFARRLDFINEANSLTEVLADSSEPASVQDILGKSGFYWGYISLIICAFIGTIAYVVM